MSRTITRIIKHEWKILTADRTLWVIAPLFALLIGYGVYNGSSWTRFQQATLEAAKQEERERFARAKAEVTSIEQGAPPASSFSNPRLPSVAASRTGPRYALAPPAPLASLAVGQSDLYPYYFKVTSQTKQTFTANDEIENPTNLLAGRFDLAFVIIYLYPLLILALSYNLISAEREQGTLAMMMSQPVSLRTFAWGKIGLRALVVLALAVGFSLTAFALGGAGSSAEGAGLRLLLWTVVTGAYGAFWFAQKARLTADDYDRFPAFTFREEPAGAVARRAMIGLIGLLVPTLLIGSLGLRALRRYSVAS